MAAARTDEIDDHVATYGPSPHPMPPQEREQRGEPGDPGFRVRGPVDEEDDPDGGSNRTGSGDGGYLPGEGTGRPYG